jgi:outer membrane protein assembly factor BamB
MPSLYPKQAMFGFDARHTHYNPFEHSISPTNVATLVPAWTASMNQPILSSPVVANGIVYLSSIDLPSPVGHVSAFDAISGTLIWTTPTGPNRGFAPDLPPIRPSSVVAHNGILYAYGGDGQLYALDAAAGTFLWSVSLGFTHFCSSPCVANGVVYACNDAGDFLQLLAIDAELGTPIWSFTGQPGSRTVSSPAVADDLVFLAHGGSLFALAIRTGELVYRFDTPFGPSSALDIHCSPAIVNQEAYIAATFSDPTSFATILYAVDSTRGSLLWQGTITLTTRTDSSPAVANGIVYIGAADQNLYAFNASSCRAAQGCDPLWAAPTGGVITSSPTVANGVVYIGSADGKLYAFDAHSGALLWTTTTGGSISSSPAVAYGMVYIGSADNQLYAFRLPT